MYSLSSNGEEKLKRMKYSVTVFKTLNTAIQFLCAMYFGYNLFYANSTGDNPLVIIIIAITVVPSVVIEWYWKFVHRAEIYVNVIKNSKTNDLHALGSQIPLKYQHSKLKDQQLVLLFEDFKKLGKLGIITESKVEKQENNDIRNKAEINNISSKVKTLEENKQSFPFYKYNFKHLKSNINIELKAKKDLIKTIIRSINIFLFCAVAFELLFVSIEWREILKLDYFYVGTNLATLIIIIVLLFLKQNAKRKLYMYYRTESYMYLLFTKKVNTLDQVINETSSNYYKYEKNTTKQEVTERDFEKLVEMKLFI